MKKTLLTLAVALMVIVGLGILFYPDISTWHNSRIHTGLVQTFNEDVARMNAEQIATHRARAEEYNAALYHTYISDPFVHCPGGPGNADHFPPPAYDYLEILNIGGIMGQIEIPIIDVQLPILHTSSMTALSQGIGQRKNHLTPEIYVENRAIKGVLFDEPHSLLDA